MRCCAATRKSAPTTRRSEAVRRVRPNARAGLTAALLAFALLNPAVALAQEEGGPLRFLKPWLDRQLRGEDQAPESAAEPDPAAPATPEAIVEPALPPTQAEPAARGGIGAAARWRYGGRARAAGRRRPDRRRHRPPNLATQAKPSAVPLRFAVLAGRGVSDTMRALGPMADELGRTLGRPVEILPMSSYAAMIDAQTERRVDGGFYSAASFAEAQARCDCLEPLVAPKAADATLAFHALIVSRSGSGIDSLDDLQGKVVALGAADSIGARRMQLAGLLEAGIDPATFFDAVDGS